ncbi:hypothetical protein HELRODRAFT_184933 [Helobdella robusta]|uniref:Protein Wnt n=1 Tax=Helobdella robusta TaxID=6412 RepID=T1FM65_HELRO|nr:hypothetical protein HELRODRAFT_184933 [Helobdella robusta]ESO06489.1 hypothetical protein HELRODRAFT_184933 [Helobdella robusta]
MYREMKITPKDHTLKIYLNCKFHSVLTNKHDKSSSNPPIKIPSYQLHTTSLVLILSQLFLISSVHCSGVYSLDASVLCNKVPGLVPEQRRLCRAYPEAMAVVGEGAELGIEECRQQFSSRRWNCSSSENEPPLMFMTNIASKESAFVSAARSAGIAYAITRACSRSDLAGCACDKSVSKSDWEWNGCSANVNYGIKFCENFLDAREKYSDNSQSLMNLHNNRAGRKVLRSSMKRNCKCSGVSGSCSVKTCWTSLPLMKTIGSKLMKTYERARQVEAIRGQRSLSAVMLKLKRSASKTEKKPSYRELVYLAESPDYCKKNRTIGVLGTKGRQCDRNGDGLENCRHVCCGRGYNNQVVTKRKKCDCVFHWCCHVTCKECMELTEESSCR